MYSVLLVDDCIADAEGMKQYVDWSTHDCKVVGIATNGLEGYEKAIELEPDIIVSDISMPVKDGLEMANMINERLSGISYIFISCSDSFEYVNNAFKTGAYAYILKPVKVEKVEEALEQIKSNFIQKKQNEDMIEYLSGQFEKSRAMLLERYLSDLLWGIEDDVDKFELFDVKSSSYCNLIILKLITNDGENMETYLNRMYLKELCDRYVTDGQCVFIEQDKVVIVAFDSDADFMEIIRKISKEMKYSLDQEVCGYIYDKKIETTKLSELFKKIINVINNNFFENSDNTVLIDDSFFTNELNGQILDVGTIQDDIYNLFSDQGDTEGFINKYYPSTPMGSVYLKSVSYVILSIINVYLFEKNCTLSQIFENESLLWKKLSTFESVFNIRQWFYNIIIAIKTYLQTLQNDSKNHKIVSNIRRYIEMNYSSESALLEASDEQRISLNYANTIFKEYYNKTIFEHLVECRIENAKKLLKTTNLKIHEIAKQVGYSSNTYFSTVFKKNTGKTPQQFRDEY